MKTSDTDGLEIKVSVVGVNEEVEKAKELVELLKKANSLACELANIDFKINL